MKVCARCKVEKNDSEFTKNIRNKDGLHSYCKECNKEKSKAFNQTEKGRINVEKAQKKQFNSGYFKYGKGAICNMSRSAKKRGVPFELTEESLQKWWNNTNDVCHYCELSIFEYRDIRDFIISYNGENFEILRFKKFFNLEIHAKINDMTIDRADNSKGYIIDNIVKSCWICNSLKSDFYTEDEMIRVGYLIIGNLKKCMEDHNGNKDK